MKYFFIPGRKWELSLEEISTVMRIFGIKSRPVMTSETLFLFDIYDGTNKVNEAFLRLGGTIKYGKIIEDPFRFIESFLSGKTPSKINFSISSYSEMSSNEIFKLGMGIKGYIKERGIHCRFVFKRGEKITSAPLLKKNDVLESGFELNIFDIDGRKVWGKTLGIQDFEGFSKRDYERPFSNKQKGMLPPKLARMMVNICGVKLGSTIWDPFCGSGTILQEALLLGYNVVGSDIDPRSVEETTGNISWIKNLYGISNVSSEIFKLDATGVIDKVFRFDAIVSEPYIGPVLRSVPGKERVESIIESLNSFYSKVFKNVNNVCKNGTKVVFVLPEFKSRDGWVKVMSPDFLPDSFQEIGLGKNLHWDRPNSIIRRQIKIFVKK